LLCVPLNPFNPLLAISGCGGKDKEDITHEVVAVEGTATSNDTNDTEPDLPDDGVKDTGSDITAPDTGTDTTDDEDDEEDTTTDTTENTTTDTEDEEDESETQTAQNYRVVSLKDLKAYPEEMFIKVGTTVEWRNVNDNLQHIIGWRGQTTTGVKPEPILQGESWSYTFNEVGTIKWFSTARPTIQGTIHVEE
jgi:plastocyanin